MQQKYVFSLSVIKRTWDFVTRMIVRGGRYLSQCSCKGLASADLKTTKAVGKHVVKSAMVKSYVYFGELQYKNF
ncbi:UNVERIFIED_CONTAM: hypothetical protein NCL1_43139 [Trichonephila clavipes]